jgi:hypothetical protein
MIKISDKILQLDKPNGTFIVFGEYDSEEVLDDFLEFIRKNLGAKIGDVQQHPYSSSTNISFPFGNATATCQGGIGCSIRIDPSEVSIVKNIVERCSAIK